MSARKRKFFLPCMFIGMGIGFLLMNWIETAFVACMFLGMGVGFLLDSLFVVEEKKIKANKVYRSSSVALAILGLSLMLVGVLLLVSPKMLEVLETYMFGFGFIIFGLFILVKSLGKM